jgi:hypothetical protein
LRTGRINLAGRTPNGHEFVANPRQVWVVKSSHPIIRGVDAGPVGPLAEQARLCDFLIPQKGVFAVVRAFLRTASPECSSRVPGDCVRIGIQRGDSVN